MIVSMRNSGTEILYKIKRAPGEALWRVSEMRFELTQPFGHYPLKVACLPIPPPGQSKRERKTGLEPATPTLARSCSTN